MPQCWTSSAILLCDFRSAAEWNACWWKYVENSEKGTNTSHPSRNEHTRPVFTQHGLRHTLCTVVQPASTVILLPSTHSRQGQQGNPTRHLKWHVYHRAVHKTHAPCYFQIDKGHRHDNPGPAAMGSCWRATIGTFRSLYRLVTLFL